jgi:hypothetical protein
MTDEEKNRAVFMLLAYLSAKDESPRYFVYGHADDRRIRSDEQVEIIIRRRHKPAVIDWQAMRDRVTV